MCTIRPDVQKEMMYFPISFFYFILIFASALPSPREIYAFDESGSLLWYEFSSFVPLYSYLVSWFSMKQEKRNWKQ